MNAVQNLDSNQTFYFARQLEIVKALGIQVQKGKLRAAEIFPIATDTPRYADTVSYYVYDARGMAKLVDAYAKDIPRVGADARKHSTTVKELALGRDYSVLDIERGAITGESLTTRLAMQNRDGILQFHNQLWWNGNAEAGITGILTDPNIPNASVVAGAATTTTWATKTPLEILKDLTDAVVGIETLTNGIEMPTLLVLTPSRLQTISNTYMSNDTSTTVLRRFNEQFPEIVIEKAQELSGAFTGGAQGFLLGRNTAEYIELQAPIVYEELEPVRNGLAYSVDAYGRNGGAVVYRPLAFTKKHGI